MSIALAFLATLLAVSVGGMFFVGFWAYNLSKIALDHDSRIKALEGEDRP